MLRIPEYWELWARRLRLEAEQARDGGDVERWCSLDEARSYAVAIARRLRDDKALAHAEWHAAAELHQENETRA